MGSPQVASGGLEPGQIIDRYQIESVLGRGGMAVVYRAKHAQLGSWHALKILTLSGASLRERLLQEGRVQASLQHPNIVAVTDVLDLDGTPVLVMEYVDGPTLDRWLHDNKPSVEVIDGLFRSILAGVASAHDRGLVHRDLKPANVLMMTSAAGVVPKVTDFGLAKALQDTDAGMKQTRSGVTMGTPQYMAPEQIRDAKSVDARADVFSLGCILYEMCAGRPPFEGEDLLAIFNNVANGRYKPLKELVPDVPDRYVAAIAGCLEVDRERRIPTVGALMQVFGGASVSGFVPIPRPSPSMTAAAAQPGNATFVGDGTLAPTPAPPTKSGGTPAPAPVSRSGAKMAVAVGGGLTLLAGGVAAVVLVGAVGFGGWYLWRQQRLDRQIALVEAYGVRGEQAVLHGKGVKLTGVDLGSGLHADVLVVEGDGGDGQIRVLNVDGLVGKVDFTTPAAVWTNLLAAPLAAREVHVAPVDVTLQTPAGSLRVACSSLDLGDASTSSAGLAWTSLRVSDLAITADGPVLSAKSVEADAAGNWKVDAPEITLRTRTDGPVDWAPVLASWVPGSLGGDAPDVLMWRPHVEVTGGTLHLTDRANAVTSATWELTGLSGTVGPVGASGALPFTFSARTAGTSAVTTAGTVDADGRLSATLDVHDLPVTAFEPYVQTSLRRHQVALDRGTFDGELRVDVRGTAYAGEFESTLSNLAFREDGKAPAKKLLAPRDEVSVVRTLTGDLSDYTFTPTNDALHGIADALFEPVGDADWRATAPPPVRTVTPRTVVHAVVDAVSPGATTTTRTAPRPTDPPPPPPADTPPAPVDTTGTPEDAPTDGTKPTTKEQIEKAKEKVDKLNKDVRDVIDSKRLPLPGR